MPAPQILINVTYPGSGSTPSYFDVAITASSTTLLPLDSLDGWCIDTLISITPQTYTANVYSSYEVSGLTANLPWQTPPVNLDRINWILNQDFPAQTGSDGNNFTYGDIQLALWTLLGNSVSTNDYTAISSYSQVRVDQIINSSVAGIGFVPDTNQYIGLIFDPIDANGVHQQPIFSPILASAMSGFVWQDENVNGLQDADEVGVANVLVNLGRDLNNDGIIQADEVLASTVTGDNPNTPEIETGYYEFKGLAPGLEYQVQFEKATGLTFTQQNTGNGLNDSDASVTGDTAKVILAPGELNQTIDAGLYSKATVGNRVWEDSNANGIQDASESGIRAIPVQLLDANGGIVATTNTDSLGNYSFSVAPGTYSVAISAPAEYVATAPNQGGNPNLDSNINTSGQTASFTVISGQTDLSLDAGFYRTASLGDQVWFDSNKDGIQDAGETGVAGVKVILLDATGNAVGSPLITDLAGNYLFTGLIPGAYSLQFDKTTLPTGYDFTSQNQGADTTLNSDANPIDGNTATITLLSGQTDLSWDAGIVDNSVTPAPIVTIMTDANNDSIINNVEFAAANTIAVNVGLPTGVVTGDTINFSDGTSLQNHLVTASDIAIGEWVTSVAKPVEGAVLTVTATITDVAGNISPVGSDSALLDTTAPSAPVVTLITDANNDGTISAIELGGVATIAVQVTVPGDTVAGETIAITDSITQQTHTLTASDLSAGFWTTNFAKPAEGTTLTVNATIMDAAGNTSASGSDSALINTAINTSAPVVTITTDANNDNMINKAEIGTLTKIAVQVDLPNGAAVGDTLVLVSGIKTVNHKVTAADISTGYWATTVSKPAESATLTVTATLKSLLTGVVSLAGTDSALLDTITTTAPVVTITTDSNNDGKITDVELGSATTIAVTVTIPTGAVVGDKLTVTDGTTPQNYILTVADITAGSWSTTFAKPVEGANLSVSATVTDMAGNISAIGSDSAVVNTVNIVPAPVVIIATDINNDGVISKSELGANTAIAVQINIPTGATVGDTMTINDGISAQSYVLTATDITAGSWFASVPKPVEGATLTVTANLTTVAGSVSPTGTDSAKLDTTAPAAPVVTISTDANNDGKITASELGSSTNIAVQVSVPAGAVAGDMLQVTDGISLQTHTLTAGDISTGLWSTTFAKPAEGATLTITATATDPAGNVSASGADSALINTMTSPYAPVVTITTDANNDGKINQAELGTAANLAVKIGLPFTAILGDTISVTSGGITKNHTVSLLDILTRTWATTIAKPAEGATATVSATLKSWLTGVVTPAASDAALLDTKAPAAPVASITTDTNNDGKITIAELGSATSISVQIQIPTDAVAGDVLRISDGVTAQTYLITVADLAAGFVNASFAKPAEGATLNITAAVTDSASNTSAFGKDSALINTATNTLGSIGNKVWEDLNFNGIQDAGENGISGVTVKLLDSAGKVMSTTTTDASGSYLFDNMSAGSYKLQVVTPTGYFATKSNMGTDPTVDSNIDSNGKSGTITLGAGQQDLAWDAGLYRKASIGDKVWEDKNHNGIQDVGEPGIANIKVMLQNSLGVTIATTTTNASGNYSFSNLNPDTYRLMFDKSNVLYKSSGGNVNLNAWKWSVQNAGTNDSVDSDVVGNGVALTNVTTTAYTTLQSGQNDMSWDAAITPIAIDLNGDGIQTIARADSQGSFDLLGNGQAIQSGWLSGQDGFLAVDTNGNGKIDNINELFGGGKGEGFAKLASYDSNGDGVVNASDDNFTKLLVWQDANGNHQTDAGELLSLSDAGVTSLIVGYTELPFLDAQQNLHLERSTATLADGQSVGITDVYFNVSAVDTAAAGVTLPSIADLMASGQQLDNLLSNLPIANATDVITSVPVAVGNNVGYSIDSVATGFNKPLEDLASQLAYVA